ncbi:MAG: XRE family transcriptional regulator [Epsilonproteobacteria bacterium]|nr:XRE family transcriptional regulator [Campylobacterota bacterium]
MEFSERIKQLRQEKKISLQELSDLSGVSKSMISKIERKEKNPTLQVATQIAKALSVTLSSLIDEQKSQPIILMKCNDRISFHDELTGFKRILLSPQFGNQGIEFIENIIPINAKSPNFPPHQNGVKEYICVSQGKLKILLENQAFELESGDTFFFHANCYHQFINIGDTECHYYLVIDSYSV